ncbi:hypothetical protein BB559_001782 [Furculomyces boomerangus]|uniref:ATP synthase subunit 5, mitochondrial n=2 Tax=Harpellales TaxID=61421 RepID=A0A2T9Z0G5_9FUNG|nr:hypothetical protein BB559_001782 [Furculomyces boomerangus]PWA02897.1 hypothetical protein BB558_000951 [Smittium angustum]
MFRSTFKFAQISRSYASGATVKAPLIIHGIEGRYATALYQSASSKGALSNVEADLNALEKKISSNQVLKEFLTSPLSGKHSKEQLLCSQKDINETTANFFKLLVDNNRVNIITPIIQSYTRLMKAHRGIVPVKVTTAVPIDSASLSQVREIVASRNLVKDFKQLEVSNTVNPSILGGMVIEFGDYTVDMSVSSKLAKLDKCLTDAISF